ncbi:unnamed protein product [Brugia timori]|uniref:Transposase n=1 Tax=Brugia timori TaxID=42155 RepID=A0A0R3RDB7_9BILA|nr:unnamed protein product [Brugia timori]
MSMKLGAQQSHIELTRKSMQKASRQQQRIVLQVMRHLFSHSFH